MGSASSRMHLDGSGNLAKPAQGSIERVAEAAPDHWRAPKLNVRCHSGDRATLQFFKRQPGSTTVNHAIGLSVRMAIVFQGDVFGLSKADAHSEDVADEGKISSYSARPPERLLRESSAARRGTCDQRGHGNDWVAFQKNRY
jgi:hypothetical protein